MESSILNSVKKNLGLDPEYVVFDHDIITHINTAFSTLNQLGIGPPEGFMIEDAEAVWEQFIGTDLRLGSVKTYVYLFVRRIFDPPTTSYLITAMDKQIDELAWRLNVKREDEDWVDPFVQEDADE